jgi:hypothetical protein
MGSEIESSHTAKEKAANFIKEATKNAIELYEDLIRDAIRVLDESKEKLHAAAKLKLAEWKLDNAVNKQSFHDEFEESFWHHVEQAEYVQMLNRQDGFHREKKSKVNQSIQQTTPVRQQNKQHVTVGTTSATAATTAATASATIAAVTTTPVTDAPAVAGTVAASAALTSITVVNPLAPPRSVKNVSWVSRNNRSPNTGNPHDQNDAAGLGSTYGHQPNYANRNRANSIQRHRLSMQESHQQVSYAAPQQSYNKRMNYPQFGRDSGHMYYGDTGHQRLQERHPPQGRGQGRWFGLAPTGRGRGRG